MSYLLDANICIYAMNAKHRSVLQKFQMHGQDQLVVSTIVAAELAFGAENSTRPNNRVVLEKFLSSITVVPWGGGAIWHYGRIRKQLKAAGTPISSMDMLIASHALDLGLTLVTNNTREFERVQGLRLENWAQ
jgi:tRNA(fMet)-specific endonuclease VapC